jgi:uncharacterized protein (TIGR02145 family)
MGILPNNYAGTVTDICGNVYKTVKIGTQTWMAENLRTYRLISDHMGLIRDSSSWVRCTRPAYCWYNYNATIYQPHTYGPLYNWYAVGSGKLCPTGWHVPTKDELIILRNYLGYDASTKLKETGSEWAEWEYCDIPTNESGFSALPGGQNLDGQFSYIGYLGQWWLTNTEDQTKAYYYELYYANPDVNILERNKKNGSSVRCIKNIDIPNNKLIAWYPLNGNANDSSGNSNNGTLYGATATTDRFGNASGALLFDGINDYIDLPDNSQLGTELTISGWVNVGSTKTWARLIEYGGGEFVNNIVVTLSTTNGKPALLLCSGSCNSGEIPSALPTYTWQHIAFTLSGNIVTCYLNGINVASVTINKTNEAVLRTLNYIGRSNFAADEYANAAFDNIRVYSRVLSHDEIISLTGE